MPTLCATRWPTATGTTVPDALRHWLWTNLGWDCYDWQPGDIRF